MADSANITRRGALSSLSAFGASAIVPAVAGEATETPIERVARLAKSLSVALDDLNADAFTCDHGGSEVAITIAHVWPSRVCGHVILAEQDIPVGLARFAGDRV